LHGCTLCCFSAPLRGAEEILIAARRCLMEAIRKFWRTVREYWRVWNEEGREQTSGGDR